MSPSSSAFSSSSKKTALKRISWNESVKVVYIRKPDHAVKQQLYYKQEDYDQFKREARIAIMRWRSRILQERMERQKQGLVSSSLSLSRKIADDGSLAIAV